MYSINISNSCYFVFVLTIFIWFSHWVVWKPNDVTSSKHLLSFCYVSSITMGAEYKCECLRGTYTGRHWFDKIKLYSSKYRYKYKIQFYSSTAIRNYNQSTITSSSIAWLSMVGNFPGCLIGKSHEKLETYTIAISSMWS